jgi:hypothetical protein
VRRDRDFRLTTAGRGDGRHRASEASRGTNDETTRGAFFAAASSRSARVLHPDRAETVEVRRAFSRPSVSETTRGALSARAPEGVVGRGQPSETKTVFLRMLRSRTALEYRSALFVWAIGLNGRLHDEGDGREFFFSVVVEGRARNVDSKIFPSEKATTSRRLTESARRMTQSA